MTWCLDMHGFEVGRFRTLSNCLRVALSRLDLDPLAFELCSNRMLLMLPANKLH